MPLQPDTNESNTSKERDACEQAEVPECIQDDESTAKQEKDTSQSSHHNKDVIPKEQKPAPLQNDDVQSNDLESFSETPQNTSPEAHRKNHEHRPGRHEAPEPPKSFHHEQKPNMVGKSFHNDSNQRSHPDIVVLGDLHFRVTPQEFMVLNRARPLITAAKFAALLSVFFGGILLSIAGLILAIIGYNKMAQIGKNHPDDPRIAARLKRPGIVAIVACCVALALNLAMIVFLYPQILEFIQSGDYAEILNELGFAPGGSGTGLGPEDAASPDGSVTWG